MSDLVVRLANKLVGFFLKGYQVCPYDYCPSWQKLNIYDNPEFAAYAGLDLVRENTLLKIDRLNTIYNALLWIVENRTTPFSSVEVGVYRGGGSLFINKCLNGLCRNYLGHFAVDTFSGHDIEDIPNVREGSHVVSMFSDTSRQHVQKLLSESDNANVMACRIQHAEIDYTTLGFVHLDTDLYGPTKWVLQKLGSMALLPYIVIVDDYGFDTCPGVKNAVDEFMSERPEKTFGFPLSTGQYIVAKL